MSQYDFGTIDPNTKSGTALATDLNSWRNALHSTHGGSSAPSYITAGMLWVDTTAANYELKMYDGAQSITVAVIDATNNVARVAVDSAETSYITSTTAGQIQHVIASSAKMTVNSTGVGIGTTSPEAPLHVVGGDVIIEEANAGASAGPLLILRRTSTSPADDDNLSSIQFNGVDDTQAEVTYARIMAVATDVTDATEDGALTFWTIAGGAFAERARIVGGSILVAKTTTGASQVGIEANSSGLFRATRDGGECIEINRLTDDGTLVIFRQAGSTEGTISVSGTTVSYNGGHLSRWAQFPDNSRPELLKGTVMSNLNQMAVWDQEDNEQLNCVQVSAVEGDANVAGVFVAWDSTDDGYNDILLAMTGDMVIRIAGGTTVQRGDLLMSAGDGTAKPQGDDIVRSKTIAKVTSTHVSHTYADGSYAVPCVLMAC
jgi:hypothetical protein